MIYDIWWTFWYIIKSAGRVLESAESLKHQNDTHECINNIYVLYMLQLTRPNKK